MLCNLSKHNTTYTIQIQTLSAQVDAAIANIDRRLAAATTEVNETNARLRALRADLVAPSHSPSTAAIEERLRTEARLQMLEDVQQRFEQHKISLISLAGRYLNCFLLG